MTTKTNMFVTLYNTKIKQGYVEETGGTLTLYSNSERQASQYSWIRIDSNRDINLSHIKKYNILENILSPIKCERPEKTQQ